MSPITHCLLKGGHTLHQCLHLCELAQPSEIEIFFFNDSDLLEQIRNSSRKGLSCSPASTGPQQGGNLQEMNYSILHRPSDSHLDASPSHTCDSGTQDSSVP